MRIKRRAVAGVALAVMLAPTGVGAQGTALGTFRWQLQPFCNVVTVNVAQQGSLFTLDGFDDQCGEPVRAPLVGLAAPNPDGSIGLGFHIVTVPGGRSVHVDARISLATASGAWSDSAGNVGTFALGGAAPGRPRPQPTIPGAQIAPGSITVAQLAPGVIGTVAQARVSGVCANGQALRGVNPDGSVVCTDLLSTVSPARGTTVMGIHSSIAIGSDGLPIISHNDSSFDLQVTHCGNAACSAGNTSMLVDAPTNFVGIEPSLAIGVDGLPVISHRDSTAGALKVAKCGTVTCQ